MLAKQFHCQSIGNISLEREVDISFCKCRIAVSYEVTSSSHRTSEQLRVDGIEYHPLYLKAADPPWGRTVEVIQSNRS
jgi:hypothetical protein